jgi:hypothetical protein
VLFEELKLPAPRRSRKQLTEQHSTSEKVLLALKEHHPLPALILGALSPTSIRSKISSHRTVWLTHHTSQQRSCRVSTLPKADHDVHSLLFEESHHGTRRGRRPGFTFWFHTTNRRGGDFRCRAGYTPHLRVVAAHGNRHGAVVRHRTGKYLPRCICPASCGLALLIRNVMWRPESASFASRPDRAAAVERSCCFQRAQCRGYWRAASA